MVPEIWYAKDRWTDGQIDAWTEKVTDRGGSPPRKTVLVLKIGYDLLNLSLLFHLTFSLTFRIEYLHVSVIKECKIFIYLYLRVL